MYHLVLITILSTYGHAEVAIAQSVMPTIYTYQDCISESKRLHGKRIFNDIVDIFTKVECVKTGV